MKRFMDLVKAGGAYATKQTSYPRAMTKGKHKHSGQTCEQAHPKTSHEAWEKGKETQEDDGVDY
jgi:hypothetical protein